MWCERTSAEVHAIIRVYVYMCMCVHVCMSVCVDMQCCSVACSVAVPLPSKCLQALPLSPPPPATGHKRIAFEEFLPIYLSARQKKDQGSMEDFIEGLKVFDKESNGLINSAELRHVLTSLGALVWVLACVCPQLSHWPSPACGRGEAD